jgi:predicted metalloprotease with PDZ domain
MQLASFSLRSSQPSRAPSSGASLSALVRTAWFLYLVPVLASLLVFAGGSLASLPAGGAQSRDTHSASPGATPPISYLLDLGDPRSHLVRVTMTVPALEAETEIQFPAWNNLYQVRDFVRNVQELEGRCEGTPVALVRVDVNTWRSGPRGCSSFEMSYGVYANDQSVFASVLDEQRAFMNFALLLFYLPRERQRGVRVKFILPAGWKLATVLEDGDKPAEFKAPDYDALADSPAEAGAFEEYSYTQGGATYRLVVVGDAADYSSGGLLAALEKITATETALMGEVPFKRYTFFLHFLRPGLDGSMEHRYGAAVSIPGMTLRSRWEEFEATAAHEFFHLWNAKRIRPQGLEPIDYIHPTDTRDLWFSEGFTSSYADLVILRAGLISRQEFYARVVAEIEALQNRSARLVQSVEVAGREAWLEKYPDYYRPERSISYYNKGAILGFLLDLAIRHASGNQASLDALMRRLNDDFARRGRFFTQADLRAIIRELAPAYADVDAFFADYVSGTREIDYGAYFRFAGIGVRSTTVDGGALDFLAVRNFDGPIAVESVEPGSEAERAGLEQGDILLKMNGKTLLDLPQDLSLKPGQKVKFHVRRGERLLQIEYHLGRKKAIAYHLVELPDATPAELRVREGWLKGLETAGVGAARQ